MLNIDIVSLEPGVNLIPARLDDAPALARLVAANAADLRTFMPKLADVDSPELASAHLEFVLDCAAKGTLLEWHIFKGEQLCGGVRLNHIEREHRKASIGYYLGAQFQGMGLVTMAVRAVLQIAFGRLGLNRIELRCASENLASQRVARRLGFTWEGLLRDAEINNGVYLDHYVHGLLRDDYEARLAEAMKQAA